MMNKIVSLLSIMLTACAETSTPTSPSVEDCQSKSTVTSINSVEFVEVDHDTQSINGDIGWILQGGTLLEAALHANDGDSFAGIRIYIKKSSPLTQFTIFATETDPQGGCQLLDDYSFQEGRGTNPGYMTITTKNTLYPAKEPGYRYSLYLGHLGASISNDPDLLIGADYTVTSTCP